MSSSPDMWAMLGVISQIAHVSHNSLAHACGNVSQPLPAWKMATAVTLSQKR